MVESTRTLWATTLPVPEKIWTGFRSGTGVRRTWSSFRQWVQPKAPIRIIRPRRGRERVKEPPCFSYGVGEGALQA